MRPRTPRNPLLTLCPVPPPKLLCLLRDSRLLDNGLTIRRVQAAFMNAFHESRLLEPYIDFEVRSGSNPQALAPSP